MESTRTHWFQRRRFALAVAALPVAALAFMPLMGGGGFATTARAEPEIGEVQFGTPSISYLTPTYGPQTGGTLVTVYGVNLGWATTVLVGGSPAAFSVVNENTIQLVTPAHAVGTYYVQVWTPGGATELNAAALFTFTSTTPDASFAVTGMSPRYGPTTGGTVVTFTGTNLWNTANVTVDGVNVPWIWSGGAIYATMPAHARGLATVNFHPTAGGVVPAPYPFAYTNNGGVLDIFAISPSYGPTWGGTVVTLNGFGFANADGVFVDGIAATYSILSDNVIQFVTPAHAAGIANVTVYDGTNSTTAVNLFTYTDFYNPANPAVGIIRPVLTSITPDNGDARGMHPVVLRGSNLTETRSITVDGVRIPFVRISDSELWLTMPLHIPGLVTVTVYNSNGTTASIGFRYNAAQPAAPKPWDPLTGYPWQ